MPEEHTEIHLGRRSRFVANIKPSRCNAIADLRTITGNVGDLLREAFLQQALHRLEEVMDQYPKFSDRNHANVFSELKDVEKAG